MDKITYNQIKKLADEYMNELSKKVESREKEMENDNNSHYLTYNVLGVSDKEGDMIDIYQNKGRFLYKYAGSFLEEAAIICIKSKYPFSGKVKIPNTLGNKPKTFEIDCLVNNLAHEIKWKDATTDGDHISKEHTRVKVIKEKGYTPIRVMFYEPQRSQAIKIQETLRKLYEDIGGKYYSGQDAFDYIESFTGINLLEILETIANDRNK